MHPSSHTAPPPQQPPWVLIWAQIPEADLGEATIWLAEVAPPRGPQQAAGCWQAHRGHDPVSVPRPACGNQENGAPGPQAISNALHAAPRPSFQPGISQQRPQHCAAEGSASLCQFVAPLCRTHRVPSPQGEDTEAGALRRGLQTYAPWGRGQAVLGEEFRGAWPCPPPQRQRQSQGGQLRPAGVQGEADTRLGRGGIRLPARGPLPSEDPHGVLPAGVPSQCRRCSKGCVGAEVLGARTVGPGGRPQGDSRLDGSGGAGAHLGLAEPGGLAAPAGENTLGGARRGLPMKPQPAFFSTSFLDEKLAPGLTMDSLLQLQPRRRDGRVRPRGSRLHNTHSPSQDSQDPREPVVGPPQGQQVAWGTPHPEAFVFFQ
ncbi:uncharacterized protein LOC115941600 isoform X1 [Leptonychotes weddellii]|uniref:Uncharacterized protein LOC115941600 isoform X1 n=1 Tax=Leptonychotes weddellii TaxID=9713 RepID=A0A7F8QYB2_LEPWE|nr:uncharacterized protein LOC115941600 isoform X1 [Leptonychotes weddellii]